MSYREANNSVVKKTRYKNQFRLNEKKKKKKSKIQKKRKEENGKGDGWFERVFVQAGPDMTAERGQRERHERRGIVCVEKKRKIKTHTDCTARGRNFVLSWLWLMDGLVNGVEVAL